MLFNFSDIMFVPDTDNSGLTKVIINIIWIHCKEISLSGQVCNSSSAPHNTLVVGHITIHHKSNLIGTLQWLVRHSTAGITGRNHSEACASSSGIVPVPNVAARASIVWISPLTPQAIFLNLVCTIHWPRVCFMGANLCSQICMETIPVHETREKNMYNLKYRFHTSKGVNCTKCHLISP